MINASRIFLDRGLKQSSSEDGILRHSLQYRPSVVGRFPLAIICFVLKSLSSNREIQIFSPDRHGNPLGVPDFYA
ncbi:MAG: hypothetical protein ACYCYP_09100 [Leptospirales bacterium]